MSSRSVSEEILWDTVMKSPLGPGRGTNEHRGRSVKSGGNTPTPGGEPSNRSDLNSIQL